MIYSFLEKMEHIQDVALPENNEEEIIRLATTLGMKHLLFCYSEKEFVSKCKNFPYPDIQIGMITSSPKIIRRANQKNIITITSSTDRDIIEAKPIMIMESEIHSLKDKLHQRNSGLNHVLCQLLKMNKTLLCFSLHPLLESPVKRRSLILGRMQQNKRLAKKYCLETACFSFGRKPYHLRREKDRVSFLNEL